MLELILTILITVFLIPRYRYLLTNGFMDLDEILLKENTGCAIAHRENCR